MLDIAQQCAETEGCDRTRLMAGFDALLGARSRIVGEGDARGLHVPRVGLLAGHDVGVQGGLILAQVVGAATAILGISVFNAKAVKAKKTTK